MSFFSRKSRNNRIKQGMLWLVAFVAFASIIIASALAAGPPTPPIVITPTVVPTVPVTPPPPPKEQPLQADQGYYGVLRYEGAGMNMVPLFYMPNSFKIIWRCNPSYGPHWLRMPVYQMTGPGIKEHADIVNFTCDPRGLKQAHGKETYPPGQYSIAVLSHVPQQWELLIETKTLDVKV